jgi:hypothetical protein
LSTKCALSECTGHSSMIARPVRLVPPAAHGSMWLTGVMNHAGIPARHPRSQAIGGRNDAYADRSVQALGGAQGGGPRRLCLAPVLWLGSCWAESGGAERSAWQCADVVRCRASDPEVRVVPSLRGSLMLAVAFAASSVTSLVDPGRTAPIPAAADATSVWSALIGEVGV